MKKRLLFIPLILAGCFATAQPMYLPDGSAGYRISCGDYVNTMADCIQKAGDLCGPNGYQAYDQNGHPKNEEAENQSVISTINNPPPKSSGRSSDTAPKSLFIKCRTNDAPSHLAPAPNPQVDNKPVPLSSVAPPSNSPATSKK